MKLEPDAIKNLKVTIMGLGLNRGGLTSALFFARRGAQVTVTDLKEEKILKPSLDELQGFPIKYTLGQHLPEDFSHADLVIKNPGVPLTSHFLTIAREHKVPIETDLSVFLMLAANPVVAVTGSKGKSTTASAIHFCMKQVYPGAKLGGNITVSPLSFIDDLDADAPVVLELSSWQLADLKDKKLLKPKVSLVTNILPDHMNAYSGMEAYIADKKLIFADQTTADYTVLNYDDPVLRNAACAAPVVKRFFSQAPLPAHIQGAWLDASGGYCREQGVLTVLFNAKPRVPGAHNRLNLLAAGLGLKLFGIDAQVIREWLPAFPGIEHRLELFHETGKLKFYNDSAATIPHATIEALKALAAPIYLITGGTDKNIDFSPLAAVAALPCRIYLLAGSATAKISRILQEQHIQYAGPYSDLNSAVQGAINDAQEGGNILFSPGCASFGMFLNEFDRGRQFKETVHRLTGSRQS